MAGGINHMKKKKLIQIFSVIVLIVIISGSLIIKGLTTTKHGNLSIKLAVMLKMDKYFNSSSINRKSIPEIRESLDKQSTKWRAKPIAFSNIINMYILTASNQVPIRIYTPEGGDKFPIIIYSHGGSWISGNLNTHDSICRKLSKKTNAIVVSVDYRLAPENPFPAGLNDVYNVLQWVSKNAESIKGNRQYICVAGDSAGGNLSAAVSQMARDKNGPNIACQVLIYPATNIFQLDSKSWNYFANDYILTKEKSQKYISLYTPKIEDRESPYASPLLTKDFKNLPDALVITAEFDPLRDEGEAYAQRLSEEGVSSVYTRYKGVTHGFISMDSLLKESDKALNEISLFVRKKFNNGAHISKM